MKIVIVGNGLAGMLLAERLAELKPTIVAPEESNAPVTALCHPFPGRSVQPHPLLMAALDSACEQYEGWHRRFPLLCRPIRMHRPLVGKGGSRLLRSAEKYESFYVGSRVNIQKEQPILPDQGLAFDPKIGTTSLRYTPAFAIDLQSLIRQRQNQLQMQGCSSIKSKLKSIGEYQITLQNGQTLAFDHLFLAIGPHIQSFFPQLNLIEEGGSLLHLTELNHQDAYSINGVHLTPNAKGESVVGSTRWSGNPPSEKTCREALAQRVNGILKRNEPLKTGGIWRGNRSINPQDRLPICGPVTKFKGVSILGALGNKGLLWGPISAKHVVNRALKNEPIPEAISINRMKLTQ